MAIEPVTLQGRFVVLRPLGLGDVPPLRALAAGPRGTFEWALVPAPEQVERYVESALSQMSRRVTLKTDERNARSRRAIERLGAHLDGILRGFQPAADGRSRNTAYYTILEQEWPEVERRLQAKLGTG